MTMSAYEFRDGIASIALDDGKVNALGTTSLAQINDHLDAALKDQAAAVILTGRPGMFSAGFDLKEVRSDPGAREHLRRSLIDIELRLFEFERPVVIACTGHALAAGAALLLSADRRIGIDGPFKLGFNEAAIGVSISAATVELARYRMTMPWFESIVSGETFAPYPAQSAGLLDIVVESEELLAQEARTQAEILSQVPVEVFREMRHAARGATAERMRSERSRL
jgi:enoyl-CoA hydratase